MKNIKLNKHRYAKYNCKPNKDKMIEEQKNKEKSNPSKRHRERLNIELQRLASLLPFSPRTISKLDKLSILRLAVNFLKIYHYFKESLHDKCSQYNISNDPQIFKNGAKLDYKNLQIHSNTQQPSMHHNNYFETNGTLKLNTTKTLTQNLPSPDNIVSIDNILTALNSFLLIVTLDGEIFYTSPSIEQYIGISQSDIIHQSVYELLYSDDRELFKSQLSTPEDSYNGQGHFDCSNGNTMNDEGFQPSSRHQKRLFTARFRCVLEETSGFVNLDISGRIRPLYGQDKRNLTSNENQIFSKIKKTKDQSCFNLGENHNLDKFYSNNYHGNYPLKPPNGSLCNGLPYQYLSSTNSKETILAQEKVNYVNEIHHKNLLDRSLKHSYPNHKSFPHFRHQSPFYNSFTQCLVNHNNLQYDSHYRKKWHFDTHSTNYELNNDRVYKTNFNSKNATDDRFDCSFASPNTFHSFQNKPFLPVSRLLPPTNNVSFYNCSYQTSPHPPQSYQTLQPDTYDTPQKKSQKYALFALCSPIGGTPNINLTDKKNTFKSKHRMDLSPIHYDSKGISILGYKEIDLLSIKGYDLVHPDDLSYYASAHQELIKTGCSGLIAYRLLCKSLDWVWLQTNSRVLYKNSKPDFVSCIHKKLNVEEGLDLFRKRGSDFKLPYSFPYEIASKKNKKNKKFEDEVSENVHGSDGRLIVANKCKEEMFEGVPKKIIKFDPSKQKLKQKNKFVENLSKTENNREIIDFHNLNQKRDLFNLESSFRLNNGSKENGQKHFKTKNENKNYFHKNPSERKIFKKTKSKKNSLKSEKVNKKETESSKLNTIKDGISENGIEKGNFSSYNKANNRIVPHTPNSIEKRFKTTDCKYNFDTNSGENETVDIMNIEAKTVESQNDVGRHNVETLKNLDSFYPAYKDASLTASDINLYQKEFDFFGYQKILNKQIYNENEKFLTLDAQTDRHFNSVLKSAKIYDDNFIGSYNNSPSYEPRQYKNHFNNNFIYNMENISKINDINSKNNNMDCNTDTNYIDNKTNYQPLDYFYKNFYREYMNDDSYNRYKEISNTASNHLISSSKKTSAFDSYVRSPKANHEEEPYTSNCTNVFIKQIDAGFLSYEKDKKFIYSSFLNDSSLNFGFNSYSDSNSVIKYNRNNDCGY